MTDELFDQMRKALGGCAFGLGSAHKRFARDIQIVPLDQVTAAQRRYVICLAWRYRRQMPRYLVPSRDAVEAFTIEFTLEREAKRRKRRVPRGSLSAEDRLLV